MLSRIPYIVFFLSLIFFVFSSVVLIKNYACAPIVKNLRKIDTDKIAQGYTLITPFTGKRDENGNFTIYLVDNYGSAMHTWKVPNAPFYAKLKPNGNLLIAQKDQRGNAFLLRGRTGILQELDWNSNVLWEYRNLMLNHDFDALPNGNVIATVWEPMSDEQASRVTGGIPGTELSGTMWSEAIIEIDRNGNVVSTWHGADHVPLDEVRLNPLYPRVELFHANSLEYVPKDPFKGQEAYLVSMREISTVFLINKKTGGIIWSSPNDMLNFQHDASYLPNGNILVFDNAPLRLQHPKVWYGSRVVEINPKTNKIVWEFDGGESLAEKAKFYNRFVGGAQRLANGNTLIIDAVNGNFYEVTPQKKVVWNWRSPYGIYKNSFLQNTIFKARKYSDEQVYWPESLLDSELYTMLCE